MALTINYVKHEDKVIMMGKEPVADYYPPGATEPIVRPADVPEPVAEVKEELVEEVEEEAPAKVSARKPVAKKK